MSFFRYSTLMPSIVGIAHCSAQRRANIVDSGGGGGPMYRRVGDCPMSIELSCLYFTGGFNVYI